MRQEATPRLLSAIDAVTRWYLTPSGAALFVAVVAGVVVAALSSMAVGLLIIGGASFVVIPYKLQRLEHARLSLRATSRQTSERADSLAGDVRVLNERAESLASEILQVREHIDENAGILDAELTDLRSDVSTWRKTTSIETSNQIQRLESRVSELRARINESLTAQEKALLTERRHLALALARRDGRVRPVRRVILLICPPRVGSTWLLDLLRQHTCIELHPTAQITRRLLVSGRRYPVHLTDTVNSGAEVEVADGVGGVIPAFESRCGFVPNAMTVQDPFYIEKLHPSFFGFDVDGFAHRVKSLRRELGGDEMVTPIYLIRDPVESIRSFISYRRRDALWSGDVPISMAHDFYRRTLGALTALHRTLSGPVLSYEDLVNDPIQAVSRLLKELSIMPDDEHTISRYVRTTEARKNQTSSTFFSNQGDKPSAVEVELGVGTDDPKHAQECLSQCREFYRMLLLASDRRL